MLSRERVIQTILHKNTDRMPIYGWLFNDEFKPKLIEAFGSMEAFEDKYEFDLVHLFPSFGSVNEAELERQRNGENISVELLLEIPLTDPDTCDYKSIKDDICHYKEKRGRFAYIQTPGYFECFNGPLGIEEHLMDLLLHPDEIAELYEKQYNWTKKYIDNVLELGVDMIHLSDDWGAQNSLLFSPTVYKELIYPFHKKTVEYIKKKGAFASLHSDGNIMSVLPDIVDIGYDVIHPYQESAGMKFDVYKEKYMDKFTVMGGLDVQTTLGFGDLKRLEADIKRIISMFKEKGLILCTTHMVQPHCSVEELVFAYELIKTDNR